MVWERFYRDRNMPPTKSLKKLRHEVLTNVPQQVIAAKRSAFAITALLDCALRTAHWYPVRLL